MHRRQQIRQAFIDALSNGTPYNVAGGWIWPVYNEILPCVIVTTRDESLVDDMIETGADTRELTVLVKSHIKSMDSLDDDLDDMAVVIEKAIYNSQQLSDLQTCVRLSSTETETSKDGEKEIAVSTLTYSVTYQTAHGDPESLP